MLKASSFISRFEEDNFSILSLTYVYDVFRSMLNNSLAKLI
ncbi:hypothetical protein SAMN05660479_00995 [Microbulbifer thermotolerans]|nr:hypothetical protein SAMN05660479_00995 [Microbulbifer thermotolerans]